MNEATSPITMSELAMQLMKTALALLDQAGKLETAAALQNAIDIAAEQGSGVGSRT